MSAFLTVLAVIAFSAIVYHYAPRGSTHSIFHLDQFRPAAPLAGFLPVNHDHERVYNDLAAIYAHQPDLEDRPERSAA